MENQPKNYLTDEHLSIGTREYLRVLNAGGRPVESLPVAEARKVLADVQAAVEVDLSGIDEREREIVADGHALTLHLVRPHGSRGRSVSYTHLTLPTILPCRSRWSPYH